MRKQLKKHMNQGWRKFFCLSLAAVVFWSNSPQAEAGSPAIVPSDALTPTDRPADTPVDHDVTPAQQKVTD